MDNSRIVFLINDTARAIMATYEDNGTAEMFKTLDADIRVGDLVSVQSTTRHKVTICKVTEVEVDVNFDGTTPLKWIISRVDMAAFDQIIAGEAQAVSVVQAAELKRKKEELRKAMFANHEDSISALALTSQSGGDLTE